MFEFIGFITVVTLCACLLVWALSPTPKYDDTDPPNGRSGMLLFIDQRTGCHYLGNPMGGIIPRVDAKGRHICEPRAEGRQ